jgi:hypothetical protein
MHALVRALALRDWDDAAAAVRHDPDDPWTAARVEQAMAGYYADYPELRWGHEARFPKYTLLAAQDDSKRVWRVRQVLVDPEGDHLWAVEGEVDLRRDPFPEGAMVMLRKISP